MKRLDWDSEFFNREIHSIDISDSDPESIRRELSDQVFVGTRPGIVYAFLDLGVGVGNAEENNFLAIAENTRNALEKTIGRQVIMADVKVDYEMDLTSYAHEKDDSVACAQDSSPEGSTTPTVLEKREFGNLSSRQRSAFEELAWRAGHKSRFNLEPFGEGECRRMYSAWIENSLNGQMADYLIFTGGESPDSLLTLKIRGEEGSIGLLAVSETRSGGGIGKALIDECISVCRASGVERLTVPTQLANTGACRFYRKCGFSVYRHTAVYHII